MSKKLTVSFTAERIANLYTGAVIDKLEGSDVVADMIKQISSAVAGDLLVQRVVYQRVILDLLRELEVDFSDQGVLLYLSKDGQLKQCIMGDWVDVGPKWKITLDEQ